MNRRLIVLLAGAGLTLAVGLALPQRDDESVEALVAPRPAAKAASAQAFASTSVATSAATSAASSSSTPDLRPSLAAVGATIPQPSGRTLTRPGADLFPSPAPEVVKAAPAPKVLPAPEFAFIGKVIDANVPMAIIRDGDRVNTLRQGDQHGGWRVTAIQDSGLQLAHLATGTEARLALGARLSPKPAQASAADVPQETNSEGTPSNDR
ncbi:MAG: hypothetical protein WCN85_12070 [Burkholderiales bacterium]